MLELRPNCEVCDKDLPPASTESMICTYECTFCSDCVNDVFENVCPNCGGGLTPRPIRPSIAWRPKVSLSHQPPSVKRIHTPYSLAEIKAFSAQCKHISLEKR